MMRSTWFLAIVVLLSLTNSIIARDYKTPRDQAWRELGKISVSDASFLNLNQFSNGSKETWVLFISTFGVNPLASDNLYYVDGFEDYLEDFSSLQPKILSSTLTWPNECTEVPTDVFNQSNPVMQNTAVVAGGFLVPGKFTGAINLITNVLTEPLGPFQISTNDFGHFYHEVYWKDMNGDGRKDAVSARAYRLIESGGQLLWYEQPEDPLQTPWQQHVLFDGPDFFFEFYDIDGNGIDELIATEYFGAQLTVFWVDSGNWSDGSVQSRIIDTSLGNLYGSMVTDVNNDGKMDLLLTNHVNNASLSGVYVYEFPEDYQTDTWTRHTLANGFQTTESGYGQASPGCAITFFPKSPATSVKPWIVLAGDGAQKAYMLTPNSEDTDDWSYTVDVVLDAGATVGQIAVADVDGDGYSEFFVPVWDTGLIYGYTFAPSK